MADIMDYFMSLIMVMLFYSFAITLTTYAMPEESLNYVTAFSDVADTIDLETVSGEVQDSIERQTKIPVLELGALVFYSGNILIDLLLNFAFAIPQMLGLLINGLMLLFNVDSNIFAIVQIFASVALIVAYFIGLMQLLTGIRSGRLV